MLTLNFILDGILVIVCNVLLSRVFHKTTIMLVFTHFRNYNNYSTLERQMTRTVLMGVELKERATLLVKTNNNFKSLVLSLSA